VSGSRTWNSKSNANPLVGAGEIDGHIRGEMRQLVSPQQSHALQQLVRRLSDTIATLLDELFLWPLCRATLLAAVTGDATLHAHASALLQSTPPAAAAAAAVDVDADACPSERELSALSNYRVMLGVLLTNRANAHLRLIDASAALHDLATASLIVTPDHNVTLLHLRCMAHALDGRKEAAEADRRAVAAAANGANATAQQREALDALTHFLRFVATSRAADYNTPSHYRHMRQEIFVNDLPAFEELPSRMSGNVPLFDRRHFHGTFERLLRVHLAFGNRPRQALLSSSGGDDGGDDDGAAADAPQPRVGSFMHHLYDKHTAWLKAVTADVAQTADVTAVLAALPLANRNRFAHEALMRVGFAPISDLEKCVDAVDAKIRGNRALAKHDGRRALAYFTLALHLDRSVSGAHAGRRRALELLGLADEAEREPTRQQAVSE
jgi:hypothetical protein